MDVKIIEIDHMGNGIAKKDGKTIFVPKTVPGDEVEIEIRKSHKKYDEGRIKRIIKENSERCLVACPYYQECGGCNISNLSYEKQLEYKKNKIINMFKRYLNMNINPEIIGSEKQFKYRNKITLHNDFVLGLVSVDNKVIETDECLLVSDKVNELIQLIKKEDLTNVKKVVIREVSNGLVLWINGKIDISNLINKCIEIYINEDLVYKQDNPYLMIGDIKYRVANNSFFQINTTSIKVLYDKIIEYADFNKNERVIDLYCGVGSISLYIAKYVKSVLGIEIVAAAIKNAKENAELNQIKNAEFRCGDVGLLIDEYLNYEKVIVDPPRAGLDSHTVEVLNNSQIDQIIYVSCDPMTLVRDIKLLDNYELKRISLVDMFPQTHHVESVILLKKKKY